MKTKLLTLAVGVLIAGLTLGAFPHTPVLSPDDESPAKRAWLGVEMQSVTKRLASEKDLKTDEGAYINRVERKSPADSAGLKKGDVIVEFDGKSIEDADDLVSAVKKSEPGKKVFVVVQRGSEKKTLYATLGKEQRKSLSMIFSPRDIRHRMMVFRSSGIAGAKLMELPSQLGAYFDAPEGQGMLVTEVKGGSAADKAGLKAGDILLKVGNRKIENMRDVRRAVSDYEEGDKVTLEILRNKSKKTLTMEVEDADDCLGYQFWMGDRSPMDMPSDIDIDVDVNIPDDVDMEDLREELEPQIRRMRIKIDGLKEEVGKIKPEIPDKVRKIIREVECIKGV
jgi:C-terminal processing protease CtpA/Prc